MKIEQNKDGVFVVDGEGMTVPVDGDITTAESPVTLTNFTFVGRPSIYVGRIKVDTRPSNLYPIRVSMSHGGIITEEVCSITESKRLIVALEKAIRYAEASS